VTEKRLHIGSGRVYLPGWTNLDVFQNVKADLYCDMMRIPYEAGTFQVIYACHVLEHCHRNTIYAVLHHWRELLRYDGVLRLSVPDFGAITQRYCQTGNLAELMGLLYGAQNHPLNVHTVTFDKKSLTDALRTVGFKEVYEWDWRKTDHAAFDDYASARLPHMSDGPNTFWMSLNLEAKK
jgi:predicted SAM-dependent methyltransferase